MYGQINVYTQLIGALEYYNMHAIGNSNNVVKGRDTFFHCGMGLLTLQATITALKVVINFILH